MPVRTKRPRLTPARALFIMLMRQYSELAYRLTLLEIQKLAYFLQEAGEPLRLKYQAHIYGPYAHDLNKVLEILEGHFILMWKSNCFLEQPSKLLNSWKDKNTEEALTG